MVALQRILVHMHTITQVTVAILFGFLYSQIYVRSHFSVYSFLLVFSIGFILSGLSVYKIDQLLKEPIPDWVDKKMLTDIKAKNETPYYLKILSMYATAKEKGITYVSWSNLEDYLDKIIEKIQQSGVQFDAVIGIKTGGAIISDYVSQKLGLPNYKVKLSRSEYNCNKQPFDTVNDIIQRQVLNNYGNYTICEGIQDDLKGKHVILIDEMVSSGKTMLETIQYLRREKHVNTIYPTCISLAKKKYKKDVHINHVLQDLVFVWPWGYDN
jgi:hypoxanthine phosphoribosyltransferase